MGYILNKWPLGPLRFLSSLVMVFCYFVGFVGFDRGVIASRYNRITIILILNNNFSLVHFYVTIQSQNCVIFLIKGHLQKS